MVKTSWWFVLAVVALAAVAGPRPLAAQSQTAVVRGLVTDAAGAAVSGAAVALIDSLGFPIATATTDAAGGFALNTVPPGTYTLRAESSAGLAAARTVAVQSALPVQLTLQLASRVSEHVVVHGGAAQPAVTTRTTLSGEALRSAPARLSSRGLPQMLATLAGWASEDNGLLHVRGIDDGFLYVEDGVPIYDRIDPSFGVAPDPSGIGSLHVMTGYVPAEYGLKSGAVIEVRSAALASRGWTGTIDAGSGSNALAAARATAGGAIGERAELTGHGAFERSDRFLDPVHPANLHNQGGSASGGVRAAMPLPSGERLSFTASLGQSRFDVPHGDVQEAAGQDQRQWLQQRAAAVSWQRPWSASVVSHVATYHRRIDAELRDSPSAVPLYATSDRRHDRLGVLGSLTWQRGRHTVKGGVEAARLDLRETFRFAITDQDAAEEAGLSEGAEAFTLDAPFDFADRVSRTQWSAYVQDSLRLSERATLDVGLRFDRTRLLVPASQWSPRAGVAVAWPETATTLRASVNRFFQPPQPEHLLLSSSSAARALSPFVGDDDEEDDDVGGGAGGGASLPPERQTAWEIGAEQWIAGRVRADVAAWGRHVRNYGDPNVFFGTTVVFPNSVAKGVARGLDVRLELPRTRGWSAYGSYTLSKVEQEGPINGGLFLEDEIGEIGPGTRFTPDHDQRHVASTGVTFQPGSRGLVAALTARYESGTPIDADDDEPDDREELEERPGADRVDFDRGRVTARFVVDLAVSQTVRRGSRAGLTVRASVLNLTNDAYALNFGNPFSGTHFGAPRTFRVDLQLGLR
jgi:outer membrane receptor for ferrienterochelin and colicins